MDRRSRHETLVSDKEECQHIWIDANDPNWQRCAVCPDERERPAPTFPNMPSRARAPRPVDLYDEAVERATSAFAGAALEKNRSLDAGQVKKAVHVAWIAMGNPGNNRMTDRQKELKVEWIEGEIRGLHVNGIPPWLAQRPQ